MLDGVDMIDGKRVIAVCMTKMHWSGRLRFLDALKYCVHQEKMKLMIFNSFVEYSEKDKTELGARHVYEILNPDIVDALVVYEDCFLENHIMADVIEKAKARGVPVIIIDGHNEGCFSIVNDYDEVYTDMIRHVIEDHHATSTFYMGGLSKEDPVSERRVNCYRRALEMCGLPFDESMVDYGEFWGDPAKRIVQRLYESGKPMPRAIFCANDYMALAVCEKLSEYGLKVPEDVLVTGFDGTEASRYAVPQITTCVEDPANMATLCLEAIRMAFDGKPCCELKNKYTVWYSESCGCARNWNADFRAVAAHYHGKVGDIRTHEDFIYSWMNRMFDIRDMNELYSALSSSILEDSYVCLNSDIIPLMIDGQVERKGQLTEQLVVLGSRYTRPERNREATLQLTSMVPCLKEWAQDDETVYILNTVYVGSTVCGYYAYRTWDIGSMLHKIKRIVSTINLSFRVAMNYFRQDKLSTSVKMAALTNSVTGLPNLKGAIQWFRDFATNENRKKTLCVSVYGLPKYTYIQENYGIAAVEEAVKFVTEALKLANPEKCFIGHIADDEFLLVHYFDEKENLSAVIGNTIDRSTSVFFNQIEEYNVRNNREYYVEVNCGCSPVDAGWEENLESFIKFAKGEMYMNRLKSGMGAVIKEETAPGEYYKAFELLIEKNLFSYHFQPIVSAKNGEIYGYEALMRTDKSIGMKPLEVLNAAREYNRLYEIERATMFNIMKRYAEEKEKFCGKKVFINTIPGHFLKAPDVAQLNVLHGEYMDRFVFELTEQNTVSDEELNAIRNFSGGVQSGRIAIDDYGTGHSNMANLLRYDPRIIKIDRFLIENIHRNQNKQLFVRSTVEFAKMNGIMVLAEGVETSNELHTVIDLGVDLVQGYYLGHPVLDPIPEIPLDIRQEILCANPLQGNNRAN